MTEDKQKLVAIAVIEQAVADLDLKPVAYDEDRGYSYRSSEAWHWLDTEGRRLMMKMGISTARVTWGLEHPKELLANLRGLGSAT